MSNTIYDLLPDGTTFKKAAKLSITYDQGNVPSGAAETELRIHKVVSGAWALVPGGGVDTKANVAWTELNGFSKYGINGPSPTTVDGKTDTNVDAGVPVDMAMADMPDSPLPPDMPKPPDMPLPPDAPKPDMSLPPDLPVPQDMPMPPDAPLPDTLAPDTTAPPTCVIDGKSYIKGAIVPGGCAVCDPTQTKSSWSYSAGCQPTHAWSKGFGGSSNDGTTGMAMDTSGNVYITGNFGPTINIGGSTLVGNTALNIFLASFTSDGKHRWSKAFSSSAREVSSGLAVDGAGNVYITGIFDTTISFGGYTLSAWGSRVTRVL